MFVTHTKARLTALSFPKVHEFRKTGVLPSPEPLHGLKDSKSSTCSNFNVSKANFKSASSSTFRSRHDRGDFPICTGSNGANRTIKWTVELAELNLGHYLPLFMDGLCETAEPYVFLAEQACLQSVAANPTKLADVIADIILPLKRALDSKNVGSVIRGVKVLQAILLANNKIAENLVPYFKNILPCFNRNLAKNKNLGAHIEYNQQKRDNISDLIVETLTLLETHGGPQAFVHIKYMIPTYQTQVGK